MKKNGEGRKWESEKVGKWANNKLITSAVICVLLLVSAAICVQAATPQKINYQGKLYEGGTPVNGDKSMIFSIHDASSGGSQLWSSGTQTVTVTNGLFNYVLGSNVSLSNVDWEGKTCYLEVTVGGQALSPRELIVSSAYGMSADKVDGKSWQTGSSLTGIKDYIDSLKISADKVISTVSGGTYDISNVSAGNIKKNALGPAHRHID